jgi:hemerythrin superfamily protein
MTNRWQFMTDILQRIAQYKGWLKHTHMENIMDIYSYLQNDHQKVTNLLEKILSTDDVAKRRTLFNEVKQLLLLHAETENATFYKTLKTFDLTKARIEHAEDEHAEIKEFFAKLSSGEFNTPEWIEQLGELKQVITHHVEEEEGEIFEKAKQVLTQQQANQLAADMDSLKQKQLEPA